MTRRSLIATIRAMNTSLGYTPQDLGARVLRELSPDSSPLSLSSLPKRDLGVIYAQLRREAAAAAEKEGVP